MTNNSDWKPISTAPYEDIVEMRDVKGMIFNDFIYDISHEEYAERMKVTHWRKQKEQNI